MPTRVAGILALVAFALCLLVGGFEAGNGFGATVALALKAMAATFVVGYAIGWAAQRSVGEGLFSPDVPEQNRAQDSATDGR